MFYSDDSVANDLRTRQVILEGCKTEGLYKQIISHATYYNNNSVNKVCVNTLQHDKSSVKYDNSLNKVGVNTVEHDICTIEYDKSTVFHF